MATKNDNKISILFSAPNVVKLASNVFWPSMCPNTTDTAAIRRMSAELLIILTLVATEYLWTLRAIAKNKKLRGNNKKASEYQRLYLC